MLAEVDFLTELASKPNVTDARLEPTNGTGKYWQFRWSENGVRKAKYYGSYKKVRDNYPDVWRNSVVSKRLHD